MAASWTADLTWKYATDGYADALPWGDLIHLVRDLGYLSSDILHCNKAAQRGFASWPRPARGRSLGARHQPA